jgi:hypothetical protein
MIAGPPSQLPALGLSGRRELLLSFSTASSPAAVRAVNEAALVPFAGIEPAMELPGLTLP